jgi:hypothetical protein
MWKYAGDLAKGVSSLKAVFNAFDSLAHAVNRDLLGSDCSGQASNVLDQ